MSNKIKTAETGKTNKSDLKKTRINKRENINNFRDKR